MQKQPTKRKLLDGRCEFSGEDVEKSFVQFVLDTELLQEVMKFPPKGGGFHTTDLTVLIMIFTSIINQF